MPQFGGSLTDDRKTFIVPATYHDRRIYLYISFCEMVILVDMMSFSRPKFSGSVKKEAFSGTKPWFCRTFLIKYTLKSHSFQQLLLFLCWCYLWNENSTLWNSFINWYSSNCRTAFYIKQKWWGREQDSGETERESVCEMQHVGERKR